MNRGTRARSARARARTVLLAVLVVQDLQALLVLHGHHRRLRDARLDAADHVVVAPLVERALAGGIARGWWVMRVLGGIRGSEIVWGVETRVGGGRGRRGGGLSTPWPRPSSPHIHLVRTSLSMGLPVAMSTTVDLVSAGRD